MSNIAVASPSSVTIDGVDAGDVFSVLHNHSNVEGIRTILLDGLVAWAEGLNKQHAKAIGDLTILHEARVKDLQTENQAQTINLIERQDAVNKAMQQEHIDQVANLNKTIATQLEYINAFGGTEKGQQLAREARRAMLLETKAKAEAELAAL